MTIRCSNPAKWHPTLHRIEVHHHPPKSWTNDGGKSSKLIKLCGLCHNEYHALLNEHVRARGIPDWSVRRTYSPYIRKLVAQAWTRRNPTRMPITVAHLDG